MNVRLIAILLPVWAIVFSFICYEYAVIFSEFKFTIQPSLMLIMFFMGLTLKPKRFFEVLQYKRVIAITTVLQYSIMPFIAYLLSVLLNLPSALFIGMILVGCVPGGTASNVIVFLAKGKVPLSIVMTFISTLLSILATPFLTWLYVGKTIDVPALAMLLDIFIIVFLPIALGMTFHHFCGRWLDNKADYFAALSVILIVWIIGIVVSLNANQWLGAGWSLLLAVILHNVLGLMGGYCIAKLFRWSDAVSKTVAIEVGMQNSGLAVVLAVKYFSAVSALPAIIFSLWHNISGGILASVWMHSSKERSGGVES